ncbi:MAG: hypothetical protein CSB01_00880 [Bacteroidia bacterium]|nr:MAG: hypothetical protein CSB01_00880 [Bacteroidia bacterium]
MNEKALKKIESLDDLRRRKKKLAKKIAKKEKRFAQKYDFIQGFSSVEGFSSNIIELLGIKDDAIATLIPYASKLGTWFVKSDLSKSLVKKMKKHTFKIFGISILIVGGLYFYLKTKHDSKLQKIVVENKENAPAEEESTEKQ